MINRMAQAPLGREQISRPQRPRGVWRRRAFAVTGAVAAVAVLGGCASGTACAEAFTVDLPADTPGASDPLTALQEWLDGTSPVGRAPEEAPPGSTWTEDAGGDSSRVLFKSGDWQVTASRTTNDEWIVTTLECL
ncbi:hypothetical protein GCM10027586_11660 [Kineococcus gypseus]|uniref:hypothetical protein n=1 Tax=Kineococcus gypseus TaxID=1637102 RepID=UPI003D7C9B24